MGLILSPSEVRSYIEVLRSYLNTSMECYGNAQQKVEQYAENKELLSVSWEASKETMHVCYQAILNEMQSVQDSILSDLDTLDGSVGDEYLDEDELEAKIKMLQAESQQYENSIAQWKAFSNSMRIVGSSTMAAITIAKYKGMIQSNEAEIAELRKKVNFLHEVENSTTNLFQSVIDLLNAVANAIHDGGVAISGGTDFIGSDLLPLSDASMDSECVEEMDDFESYLIAQGFPEGYRKYLMELHEKYPEWRFEAVITGVDFQEFVNYQIVNELKCAESSAHPIFCTDRDYKGEKSNIYHVANNGAIGFFSNPYCLLQTEKNAMQFLKAEQELPREYVDLVVPQILEGKNQEIVDSIKNTESCINPVFIACIYKIENGPVSEVYQGKKVYNLFNIGGYTGKEDALKYAYEHQWFTPEACINGSEEVFQKYVDNGQDTLYALDWDFQTYANTGGVRQYATLVNDAYNKARPLSGIDGVILDLDYDLVFKIPVYENIPAYSEEENEQFMRYVKENM